MAMSYIDQENPPTGAGYNPGDIVVCPSWAVIQSWLYVGDEQWVPNDTVRYKTNLTGGISIYGVHVVAGLISNDETYARDNHEKIKSAIDSGGFVSIPSGLGVVFVSGPSFLLKSNSELNIGVGTTIKAASGRLCPLVRNQYGGHVASAASFVRSGNVCTVNDPSHSKVSGDVVNISRGPNATFRGIHVILSTTDNSWSFASTGANETAGTSAQFFDVIPLCRSVDGSSFVGAAGWITVIDPGHDLSAGMSIYTCSSNGLAHTPGMVKVAKTSKDTWSYFVSGVTTTGTGAVYLGYDKNIKISGGGAIDGNRLGLGAIQAGNEMLYAASMFGVVNDLSISVGIGGSSMRGICAFNCSSVRLLDGWHGFDNLVAAQFEGGASGVYVNSGAIGSACFDSASSQQADDYIAFSGTIFANGAIGHYDNTISPYGLTNFEYIDVDRVVISNALNGVKIAADATCKFKGVLRVGSIRAALLDGSPSLPVYGAVRIMDDGPGLLGTTFDQVSIESMEWGSAANGKSAVGVSLSGTGVGNKVTLRDYFGFVGNRAVVLQTGMSVGSVIMQNSIIPYFGTSVMPVVLSGGTLKRLIVESSSAIIGTQGPLVYLSGATVGHIKLENIDIGAAADNTGVLIDYSVAASLTSVSISGIRQSLSTANRIASLVSFGNISIGAVQIKVDDCDVVTGSGVTSSGTGTTGSPVLNIGGTLKWTPISGNKFVQMGGGTWTININNGASIQAERICLFGFGSPTYRIKSFSSDATVNLNDAPTYGSAQMAPVNGDEIWNSTGGTIPVGRCVRRAGAWSAI